RSAAARAAPAVTDGDGRLFRPARARAGRRDGGHVPRRHGVHRGGDRDAHRDREPRWDPHLLLDLLRLPPDLGRRPAYLVGLGLFLLGSALAGLSRSMEQLIAFRALQGLGAGSLITIGMTIIGDLYGMERRARMQGYFSSVWGIASLVGPLIGGLLTDRVSWRWVFYINLPFGLLAAAAIAIGLRDEGRNRSRVSFD